MAYPPIKRWVIPADAFSATLDGVRPAGLLGKESGAFWLGDRTEKACVTTVILPRGEGVEESSGCWRVSPEVFGAITTWAVPRRRCLLVIAHTHMRGMGISLSWTDRNRSVRVPGMIAVVIGDGGQEDDHRKWGWHVHEDGQYRQLLEPELSVRIRVQYDARIDLWHADVRGVYPGGM
jgi:hypothetical protein